jgi:hypothetical protein
LLTNLFNYSVVKHYLLVLALLLSQTFVVQRTQSGYGFDAPTKEPVVGTSIRTTQDNTGIATNKSDYFSNLGVIWTFIDKLYGKWLAKTTYIAGLLFATAIFPEPRRHFD